MEVSATSPDPSRWSQVALGCMMVCPLLGELPVVSKSYLDTVESAVRQILDINLQRYADTWCNHISK